VTTLPCKPNTTDNTNTGIQFFWTTLYISNGNERVIGGLLTACPHAAKYMAMSDCYAKSIFLTQTQTVDVIAAAVIDI